MVEEAVEVVVEAALARNLTSSRDMIHVNPIDRFINFPVRKFKVI